MCDYGRACSLVTGKVVASSASSSSSEAAASLVSKSGWSGGVSRRRSECANEKRMLVGYGETFVRSFVRGLDIINNIHTYGHTERPSTPQNSRVSYVNILPLPPPPFEYVRRNWTGEIRKRRGMGNGPAGWPGQE